MSGQPASLLRQGAYSLEHLAGPGPKRVLDLGAGSGGNAAAIADLGHDVTADLLLLEAWQYVVKLVPARSTGRAG